MQDRIFSSRRTVVLALVLFHGWVVPASHGSEAAEGAVSPEAASGVMLGLPASGASTGAETFRLPGSRFGLGVDLWAEGLDSFQNTWAETLITQTDANGTVTTRVIPGDPGLNNRKFDYRWELRSFGAQVPVALPDFSLGRIGRLYPRFTLEAARVEATLEVLDRTGGGADLRREGEGTLWGVGLDLVGRFGEEDRWFAGGGYRYRELSNLDLSSALPPVGPPALPPNASTGVPLPVEEVRLDRREHAVTGLVGRAIGDRLFPYVGLRGRLADLEVDDSLEVASSFPGLRFQVRSSSRLESDAVLAVAGVDARLGPLVAHLEAVGGDGDWGGLLKLVYARWPEATSSADVQRSEHTKRRERWLRRAAAISAALFPLLEGVERRFHERLRELESAPYGAPEAEKLLDVTEADLLEVLGRFEDLGALRAYAGEFFRRKREEIGEEGPVGLRGGSPPPAGGAHRVAFAGPLHSPEAVVLESPADEGGWSRFWGGVGSFLGALATGARDEELYIEVEISVSDTPLRLCPGDVRPQCLQGGRRCGCREGKSLPVGKRVDLWRGLHMYRFRFPRSLADSSVACQDYLSTNCDERSLECSPVQPSRDDTPQYVQCTSPSSNCILDLWLSGPRVRCLVSESGCGCEGAISLSD